MSFLMRKMSILRLIGTVAVLLLVDTTVQAAAQSSSSTSTSSLPDYVGIERVFEHSESLPGSTLSNDGKYAAVIVVGGIGLWDVKGEKQIWFDSEQGIFSAEFNASGEKILGGSSDGTVRVWNTENGCCEKKFKNDGESAIYASFLGDDRVIAGGRDGTLCIWTIGDDKESECQKIDCGSSILAIACSPGSSHCVTMHDVEGSKNEIEVKKWNLLSREIENKESFFGQVVREFKPLFDKSGKEVAFHVKDDKGNDTVVIWDTTAVGKMRIMQLTGNVMRSTGNLDSDRFDLDKAHIVAKSGHVYSLKSGKNKGELKFPDGLEVHYPHSVGRGGNSIISFGAQAVSFWKIIPKEISETSLKQIARIGGITNEQLETFDGLKSLIELYVEDCRQHPSDEGNKQIKLPIDHQYKAFLKRNKIKPGVPAYKVLEELKHFLTAAPVNRCIREPEARVLFQSYIDKLGTLCSLKEVSPDDLFKNFRLCLVNNEESARVIDGMYVQLMERISRSRDSQARTATSLSSISLSEQSVIQSDQIAAPSMQENHKPSVSIWRKYVPIAACAAVVGVVAYGAYYYGLFDKLSAWYH